MPRSKSIKRTTTAHPLATAHIVAGAQVLNLTCPVCQEEITAAERTVRMHMTGHFKKGDITDPQRERYVRELTLEAHRLWREDDRRFREVKMKEAFGDSLKGGCKEDAKIKY